MNQFFALGNPSLYVIDSYLLQILFPLIPEHHLHIQIFVIRLRFLGWTFFACNDSFSFSNSFNCVNKDSILLTIFSSFVFSSDADFSKRFPLFCMNSNACLLVTASILLTPAPIPLSETILNKPISALFST